MQFFVSPVSYTRLHRLSDTSVLRLSFVVIWQIIVVPKLFLISLVFSTKEWTLCTTVQKKQKTKTAVECRIQAFPNWITYRTVKQLLHGIAGTETTYAGSKVHEWSTPSQAVTRSARLSYSSSSRLRRSDLEPRLHCLLIKHFRTKFVDPSMI